MPLYVLHNHKTTAGRKRYRTGISPDIRTLAEIEALDRFVEPDCKGALCDILWCV